MKKLLIVILPLLLVTTHLKAQQNVVIESDPSLTTPEILRTVESKLSKKGLVYTTTVDFSKKCEYNFVKLSKSGSDILMRVENCKGEIIGNALIGNQSILSDPEEYATLMVYQLVAIINKNAVTKSTEPETKPDADVTVTEPVENNEHTSRYMFAPSAFNLKKGEFYLNTNYFMVWDVQYGISDNFSLGVGTTVALIPMYLTPKLSFAINEKNRVAVGDLLVLGTWGNEWVGNIAYAGYTYGSQFKNVTLSAGMMTTQDLFEDADLSRPVLNFSFMNRLSNHMYLVGENYLTRGSSDNTYETWDPSSASLRKYPYSRVSTSIMGALAFRVISKRKDVTSFQFGIAYFNNLSKATWGSNGPSPDDYDIDNSARFILPTVTFFHKLGSRI